MSWKNLTFILIPHSQSNIKQIKVHRYALLGMALFLVAAIGIMIFYIIGFQRKSFLLSRSRDIERQNILLEKIVADFDSSLTTLNSKIDSLETTAEKIRREAGISATDLRLHGDMKDQFTEPGFKLSLQRILSDIDRIERRSYVFERNFDTLYNKCMLYVDFLRHLPSIRPTEGTITKDFEFVQYSDNYSEADKSHPGVSIVNVEGTPIAATADGVVSKVENYSDELGRYIEIDHQNGYKTRYTHLQPVADMANKINLKAGDKVTRGQQIACMGRTGFSIRAIAPQIMYTIEHKGTYVDPNDYFLVSDSTHENPGETPLKQNQ